MVQVAQHPTWLDWSSQETSLPTSALNDFEKWLRNVIENLDNPSPHLLRLIYLGIGLVLRVSTGPDNFEFWIEIAGVTASE